MNDLGLLLGLELGLLVGRSWLVWLSRSRSRRQLRLLSLVGRSRSGSRRQLRLLSLVGRSRSGSRRQLRLLSLVGRSWLVWLLSGSRQLRLRLLIGGLALRRHGE